MHWQARANDKRGRSPKYSEQTIQFCLTIKGLFTILDATRRLGRKIWKRWTGYHRRSLVETKMRCFKLLGERVMARDFDRQVAELEARAAILNRFTLLGTPVTVAMP